MSCTRWPWRTRPWQHVLDPIVGYVMTAEVSEQDNLATAFNFGPNGDSLSVADVCAIAKTSLNSNMKIEDPNPTKAYEANFLYLDSTKAREVLMWKNNWTQSDAISSTLTWRKSVLAKEMSADDACERDLDLIASSRHLS